jgi:hypothetical protein
VPWLLDSSELLYGRRSRPIPGQERRGEPRRPVPRRALQPAVGVQDGRPTPQPSNNARGKRPARTRR